jgi:hypothetical protein
MYLQRQVSSKILRGQVQCAEVKLNDDDDSSSLPQMELGIDGCVLVSSHLMKRFPTISHEGTLHPSPAVNQN